MREPSKVPRTFVPAVLPALLALLAAGACGGNAPDGPLPSSGDAPLVEPAVRAVAPGESVQFTANLPGAGPVQWRVEGAAGGSTTTGVIDAHGQYTAPAAPHGVTMMTVTAVSPGDTTKRGTATVLLLPSDTGSYNLSYPRVVQAGSTAPLYYVILPPGSPTRVEWVPSFGPIVQLTKNGPRAWVLSLTNAQATAGYVPGELHAQIGNIDEYAGATRTLRLGISTSVRDAGMPDVTIVPLAADAQRTDYVLNLREDQLFGGTAVPASIVAHALALLGDNFDFVAVVEGANATANRFYTAVRNSTGGLGLSALDHGPLYGSAARLQGVVQFPILEYCDAGEKAMAHEIGHHWINYGSHSMMLEGIPHWPLGDVAYGIMGFSLPPGNAGGDFPFTVTMTGGGGAMIHSAPRAIAYNAMELYLMGLLPPDSVPTMLMLPVGTSTSAIHDRAVFATSRSYSVADWIAAEGARVPASATSQRAFRMAMVVLSHGRLLDANEMAFLDYNARRAEATAELNASIGFSRGPTLPFFAATGGRATLQSRLTGIAP